MDRDNNSIHDWMFVIFQWWPSKSFICCDHNICCYFYYYITVPTSILHLAAKRVNWLGGIIWLICEEVLSLTSNIGTYIYFYMHIIMKS